MIEEVVFGFWIGIGFGIGLAVVVGGVNVIWDLIS